MHTTTTTPATPANAAENIIRMYVFGNGTTPSGFEEDLMNLEYDTPADNFLVYDEEMPAPSPRGVTPDVAEWLESQRDDQFFYAGEGSRDFWFYDGDYMAEMYMEHAGVWNADHAGVLVKRALGDILTGLTVGQDVEAVAESVASEWWKMSRDALAKGCGEYAVDMSEVAAEREAYLDDCRAAYSYLHG